MAVCRSPHPLSVFVLCAFLLVLCLPWQQTLAADARQAVARERGFELQEHALSLYAHCTKTDCEHRSRPRRAGG